MVDLSISHEAAGVMAETHVLPWARMTSHAWQFVLAGLALLAALVGITYILVQCVVELRQYLQRRRAVARPGSVTKYITERLNGMAALLQTPSADFTTAASKLTFGVFLGHFSAIPTPDEQSMLSRWSVLVLDPSKENVHSALEHADDTLQARIARVDFAALGKRCQAHKRRSDKDGSSVPNDKLRANIEVLLDFVAERVCNRTSQNPAARFNGLLVANWEDYVTPGAMNELMDQFAALNVKVYIEASAPHFIREFSAGLTLASSGGVIFRNGSMLENGTRRDFFDLIPANYAIRLCSKQTMLRSDFVFAMYEVYLDGEAWVPTNAQLMRSATWSDYFGAKTWIGCQSALTNAALNHKLLTPLSAFDWLKQKEIIKAHTFWARNAQVIVDADKQHSLHTLEAIDDIFPGLSEALAPVVNGSTDVTAAGDPESTALVSSNSFDIAQTLYLSGQAPGAWANLVVGRPGNPLSDSPRGYPLSGLGAFSLASFPSPNEFNAVVETQSKLRQHKTLTAIEADVQLNIAATLEQLALSMEQASLGRVSYVNDKFPDYWVPQEVEVAAVSNIAELLGKGSGRTSATSFEMLASSHSPAQHFTSIRVYSALDTGLCPPCPADHPTGNGKNRFNGVYEVQGTTLNIYVSRRTQNLGALILHTALSAYGMSRASCFSAELLYDSILAADQAKLPELPLRLEADIAQLSPAEALRSLQHITMCDDCRDDGLTEAVGERLQFYLVQAPSAARLKQMHAEEFLSGRITPEELIRTRLNWFLAQGASALPSEEKCVEYFKIVDRTVAHFQRHYDKFSQERVSKLLVHLLDTERPCVDMASDLFSLMLLCAIKRLAFEEVMLEATDRLPLLSNQPDQAAVYAEMWIMGSNCEIYFDCTPKRLGIVLWDYYRGYLHAKKPAREAYNGIDLFTAYPSAKTDVDQAAMKARSQEDSKKFRAIAYFGVFAIPALIDVMMLTFHGRGLYLSVSMSAVESRSATLALVISLVICGPFTNWIGAGGSYYKYAMTHAVMVNFVANKVTAAMLVAAFGSVLGFVFFTAFVGPYAGLIFFCYFMLLSTYFTCMGALCVLHWGDHPLPSGRTAVGKCLMLLLVSPIVTTYVHGWDIAVYLPMLAIFTVTLYITTFRLLATWTNWLADCPTPKDDDILDWYARSFGDGTHESVFAGLTAPGALERARLEFSAQVTRERHRRFWQKPTQDPFVAEIAAKQHLTSAILKWYSGHFHAFIPLPYSSTWALQSKVALDTLRSFDKGLAPHSAFILWRHCSPEVAFGVIYFVLALLDRWIELICGGQIIGLVLLTNGTTRIGISLGLIYYLMGAVVLDIRCAPLYILAQKTSSAPLRSLTQLREASTLDARALRKMYWTELGAASAMMSLAFAFCALLVWLFVDSAEGFAIFCAYVAGYTGLMWFQYNRVFAGNNAMKPVLTGVALGLAFGLPIRICLPDFAFGPVIALNVATWSASLLSLAPCGLFSLSRADPEREYDELSTKDTSRSKSQRFVHSQDAIGLTRRLDDKQKQALLRSIEELQPIPSNKFSLRWDPSGDDALSSAVRQVLEEACAGAKADELAAAFPTGERMLNDTLRRWQEGRTEVKLVSEKHFDPRVRALSYSPDDTALTVYISMPKDFMIGTRTALPFYARCIAEAVVHETFEVLFNFSHTDAVLAELLVSPRATLEVPSRVFAQLFSKTGADPRDIVAKRDTELSRHLALGLNPDECWTELPENTRKHIVKRFTRTLDDDAAVEDEAHQRWIKDTFSLASQTAPSVFVARRNLHARLVLLIDEAVIRSNVLSAPKQSNEGVQEGQDEDAEEKVDEYRMSFEPPKAHHSVFRRVYNYTLSKAGTIVKLFFICLCGDKDFQRELLFAMRHTRLRHVVVPVCVRVWMAARLANVFVTDLFLFQGRPHLRTLAKTAKNGYKTTLRGNRVQVQHPTEPVTAFVQPPPPPSNSSSEKLNEKTAPVAAASTLRVYDGRLDKEPEGNTLLRAICYYDDEQRLLRRETYKHAQLQDTFEYNYKNKDRTPAVRKRLTADGGDMALYDKHGRISGETRTLNGRNYACKLHYHRKRGGAKEGVIRVEYATIDDNEFEGLEHDSFEVYYSNPPTRKAEDLTLWVPQRHITRLITPYMGRKRETIWTYDHKSHPVISTQCEGHPVPNPDLAVNDTYGVHKPPTGFAFKAEDPAFGLSLPGQGGFFGKVKRAFAPTSRTSRFTTWKARETIWRGWKNSSNVDGVAAMYLDEQVLRGEPLLRPYWHARDRGNFRAAIKYLKKHAEAIEGAIGMAPEVSGWTILATKMSDLFAMGGSSNMVLNTRTADDPFAGPEEQMHVLATDTGTWPTEGGGVSCCRRDVVDNLKKIRWHIVAEVANDLGMPRFQIENQVASVKLLAQWGLDFLTPHHGILQNILDGQVDERIQGVSDAEIKRDFIPLLRTIVMGTRTRKFSKQDIKNLTQALLDLNSYFETRDWNRVWRSDPVKKAFRRFWLDNSAERISSTEDALDIELPTIGNLDDTLDLYSRYLFIFALPVPAVCPPVFQATHHSIGALYGILCKIKRNCSFQVWDHSIIWRECNTFLSASQCSHPPFVQNALLGIMRMAAVLNLHHCDVVLPCTDLFNPEWEVELGTEMGVLEARETFARKIDAVVNGICNMDSFEPVEKVLTEKPTVTMLSHVQYVKDIKTALLAADIIVNEWGFSDYRLHIYGGLDRMPSYTVECQELLASKGLRGFVEFKGYGNPKKVLADTWLFLNSSISEGLPLAIGEAALTGAPIVCTDVGATALVLQDIDDPSKLYGEVVNPNRARDLARAQINVLGVMGQWADYAEVEGEDPWTGGLCDHPTIEQVNEVQARMYTQSENRRRLGLNMRTTVQKKFDGDRYLREHEQMLWAGKELADGRRRMYAGTSEDDLVVNYKTLENMFRRPTMLQSVSGFSAFSSSGGTSRTTSTHNLSSIGGHSGPYFGPNGSYPTFGESSDGHGTWAGGSSTGHGTPNWIQSNAGSTTSSRRGSISGGF